MSDENDTGCTCDETTGTRCDLDRTNNMWVEGGDPKVGSGLCLLDSMSDAQIVYSLQHNQNAARDLLRVTSDPHLRELAATVELLPTAEEEDKLQSDLNRNDEAGSIPFYAIFRGQPPFAQ